MRVVVATGGTGGHIYPAISLIDGLKENGLEDVLFIGSNNRMESLEIPKRGYKFKGLNVVGTNGGITNKLKSIVLIIKSVFICINILKEFNPNIVIGFGNYISVPVIIAAKILGIKTMIHEQNSVAGKANKFLSKFVDVVVGSYEENLKDFDKKKTKILGNPRASEASSIVVDKSLKGNFGFDVNKKLVLIVMGSLGSSSVSEVLMDYANKIKDKNYNILIVTGEKQYDLFNIKEKDYIKKVKYIEGIQVMALADLVVTRAGATTCAEVCALKKPSIIIPSPYVPNNHQLINGRTLQNVNATILIEESNLNAEILDETIEKLINDDELMKCMSKNAESIAKVNARDDIINLIKEVII
ncbi:MAG: undecaprenyldiphospho-muramoylpentapeptide beta-N-acetylglucosaminyltransferase [Erysipelotrichaceae bacterium]|nr:undecaprenyldiphospho-muramoylpentapeptide beta-N-acetylglucosaminyltransferase [Erysipelotrichaceae bacterium]